MSSKSAKRASVKAKAFATAVTSIGKLSQFVPQPKTENHSGQATETPMLHGHPLCKECKHPKVADRQFATTTCPTCAERFSQTHLLEHAKRGCSTLESEKRDDGVALKVDALVPRKPAVYLNLNTADVVDSYAAQWCFLMVIMWQRLVRRLRSMILTIMTILPLFIVVFVTLTPVTLGIVMYYHENLVFDVGLRILTFIPSLCLKLGTAIGRRWAGYPAENHDGIAILAQAVVCTTVAAA